MSAVKYRRYITKFYNKTAIIRDHQCFTKIIALLETIDQYHFDLTLNSSLLNTWPNSTLMLAGYWTPALKNNPLHSNNPEIAEAVDVNNSTEILNDHMSEESYNSSLSSSFIDSELLRRPATTMDEDTMWNLIMKQPSTSFIPSRVTQDINSVEVLKEDSSGSEIVAIGSSNSVTKEIESSLQTLTTEEKIESIPINDEIQSFNDLLESYNSKVKKFSESPKIENLYKQLTAPKIIEEQYFNNSEPLDDVIKTKIFVYTITLNLTHNYYNIIKFLFTD